MDHHTTLKLVPCQLACLKTSGCTAFGPLNTKESNVLAQNVFIIQLWNLYSCMACLKTSGCAEFGPLNSKESDVLAQNVFSQKWIIIQLWNLYHCNWHTFEGVHRVWPSKLKGKWCFSPKCVFSETDHRYKFETCAIVACLKTSGCAEFGPLNMKESDVLAQNVFSQKQIIIQLWNLYHCNWHTWKLQGVVSLAL